MSLLWLSNFQIFFCATAVFQLFDCLSCWYSWAFSNFWCNEDFRKIENVSDKIRLCPVSSRSIGAFFRGAHGASTPLCGFWFIAVMFWQNFGSNNPTTRKKFWTRHWQRTVFTCPNVVKVQPSDRAKRWSFLPFTQQHIRTPCTPQDLVFSPLSKSYQWKIATVTSPPRRRFPPVTMTTKRGTGVQKPTHFQPIGRKKM